MKKRLMLAVGVLPILALQMSAASGTIANPLSEGTKKIYGMLKDDVLKSAEEMPESDYNFRPVSTVRTFGELVGHVADGQYEFCSALMPTKEKTPEIEKTKKGKTELVEALKTSFAYCDKAYDSMTDEQAVKTVDFFGHPYAEGVVLSYNNAHTDEHYGNLVTYLRMKGLVPPSSKK